jgi:hypothetical protein
MSAKGKLIRLLKEERAVLRRQLEMLKSCQLDKMMKYVGERATRRLTEIDSFLSECSLDSATESKASRFENEGLERLVEFNNG